MISTADLSQLSDAQLEEYAARVADQYRQSDSFEADEAFMQALNEMSKRERAGEIPLLH